MPEWLLDPRRLQFKKLRLLLAWLGGILLILNSHINDVSFRWGLPVLIFGECIRILASGYLERKGTKLATAGPFAYVRNPLYVGNFFLGLGFVIMSWSVVNIFIFIFGFCMLYWGTVKKEEARLLQEFGAPYADYLKEVPRFFPSFKPYSKRTPGSFQWQLIIKHREYITLLGIVIAVCGFYIWEELLEDGRIESVTKTSIAAGLIIASALTLLINYILKRLAKKQPTAS